ncbi:MAG: ATPase domain-containing protein [Aquabacterium sp.]
MSSTLSPLQRLSSGVLGLDLVLGGGFFQSGVYIVRGLPGSGKTILANQLCYHAASLGKRAVYVTLLAESHSRMLQHISDMSFFDESYIPSQVSYISAFSTLEADGLKGLMTALRNEMRARRAHLLVLDGLVAAAEAAPNDQELKKFIHELQTSAVFHDCTIFLLTSGTPSRITAEHTMVDGIIELEETPYDARCERSIQVRKFRGSGSLRGRHPVRITEAGLQIFPRIEAVYAGPPETVLDKGPALGFGVPSFDRMIEAGGVAPGSATVIVGSTGTGKTTLGTHFLAQSTNTVPGLMCGFFESPQRLCERAGTMGLDLASLERQGIVKFMWHSQGEHVLDELGHRLLDEVRRMGAKRLVIDGLSGFFESAVYPERITRFFSCLTNELRRLGVAVVMTLETRDILSSIVPLPYGVSGFVDNLVFMRFAEQAGQIRSLLNIVKMRDSQFEHGLHAFSIGRSGLVVDGLHTGRVDVIPATDAVPPGQ